jgi:hypothetical protein
MHVAALPLALSAAALMASSSAAAPRCSCEDQRECTTLNEIPIVYAARDVVRKKFLDLGARLLEHTAWTDDFSAPKGEPYNHVLAFYVQQRRLSKLRFSYPKEDFDGIIRDYVLFSAIAEQVTETGAGTRWRMHDGAQISVWHDDDGSFVDFTALAMDAQFSAEIRSDYRSPMESNRPPQRVRDPDAPTLSISASNPHQGLFEFHSEVALLQGTHDLREDVCGLHDDFDWGSLRKDRESGYVDNKVKSLHFEIDRDGLASVKLALADEFGPDIYRFLDVRPGVPTPAAADGDCRRRKVSVTYTPTQSSMCLDVLAVNTPSYAVVQKLIEVTGASIVGAEFMPRKEARVTLDFEISAKDLLLLLGDVTDLELVENGPGTFEFRKPAAPAH